MTGAQASRWQRETRGAGDSLSRCNGDGSAPVFLTRGRGLGLKASAAVVA